MNIRTAGLAIVAAFCLVIPATGQSYKPTDKVPLNPKIKTGILPNGTKYYIMQNSEPKQRLDMYLAVDAGAVFEDDDQNGLAHFCEHMAFNGTQGFPKQELVSFLESTGIRFGADLNAYTNQDETVYTLTVPLDNIKNVVKGIQVLRDWAGFVLYDSKDIEEERGVVMEEWRLRSGAGKRVNQAHNKVLLAGSKYAERDIIGDTNVLKRAPGDNLRRFYKTWYTPDRMAVILVGDMSVDDLEALVMKNFTVPSAAAGGTKARQEYPITPRTETAISIVSDKELTAANVAINYIKPPSKLETYGEYRKAMISRLGNGMMNIRFSELAQKTPPAITYGNVGTGSLTRSNDGTFLRAAPPDKNVMKAFNVLLTEIERVKRHGFTKTEMTRVMEATVSGLEAAAAEANTTPNSSHAGELVRVFLHGEAAPGIQRELDLHKEMYASISLEEVNAAIRQEFANPHRVITVSVPEGNGYTKPTEAEVRNMLALAGEKNVDAYVDQVPTKPLLATKPTPGSIVKKEMNNEIGAMVWTLSNGAKVIVKPTDFKNDEIQFAAWAPGGQSTADVKDQVSIENAMELVSNSGLGEFGPVELQRMLNGKNISFSASSDMEWFKLNGGSTPKDLGTFFEALYLGFTAPRKDPATFESIRERIKVSLANKDQNPEAVYGDSMAVILADHHPRVIPTTVKSIEAINLDVAYNYAKGALANAGAYTFVFVGNIKPEVLEEYVKTYIASLPSTSTKMMWKDAGIDVVKGKVKRVVNKGVEPKSAVTVLYSGPMKFSDRYDVIALSEVMTIKLRERLREKMAGVYFVSVSPQTEMIPKEEYGISIYFTCEPQRVDELLAAVDDEIQKLKTTPVDAVTIDKVREIQSKERENAVKNNAFWLRSIEFVESHKLDYKIIRERTELIKKLNAQQVYKAANTYLSTPNVATVILKPEKI